MAMFGNMRRSGYKPDKSLAMKAAASAQQQQQQEFLQRRLEFEQQFEKQSEMAMFGNYIDNSNLSVDKETVLAMTTVRKNSNLSVEMDTVIESSEDEEEIQSSISEENPDDVSATSSNHVQVQHKVTCIDNASEVVITKAPIVSSIVPQKSKDALISKEKVGVVNMKSYPSVIPGTNPAPAMLESDEEQEIQQVSLEGKSHQNLSETSLNPLPILGGDEIVSNTSLKSYKERSTRYSGRGKRNNSRSSSYNRPSAASISPNQYFYPSEYVENENNNVGFSSQRSPFPLGNRSVDSLPFQINEKKKSKERKQRDSAPVRDVTKSPILKPKKSRLTPIDRNDVDFSASLRSFYDKSKLNKGPKQTSFSPQVVSRCSLLSSPVKESLKPLSTPSHFSSDHMLFSNDQSQGNNPRRMQLAPLVKNDLRSAMEKGNESSHHGIDIKNTSNNNLSSSLANNSVCIDKPQPMKKRSKKKKTLNNVHKHNSSKRTIYSTPDELIDTYNACTASHNPSTSRPSNETVSSSNVKHNNEKKKKKKKNKKKTTKTTKTNSLSEQIDDDAALGDVFHSGKVSDTTFTTIDNSRLVPSTLSSTGTFAQSRSSIDQNDGKGSNNNVTKIDDGGGRIKNYMIAGGDSDKPDSSPSSVNSTPKRRGLFGLLSRLVPCGTSRKYSVSPAETLPTR
eukprot:TRINITY_DN2583_c0_g1_i6.p1 TRINITY_DN2583_c0_g1~~TRINITY_DN2583_c0_g1_i6.p1  ORF type:complete len:687 (-),score=193.66 TRINITY_DN2583_c0_g1_i6:700-2730(-)